MSTRTKVILRIVVTLVILGLIVLGVWLIWFRPTNELEIFQNLTALQNDSEQKFFTARGKVEKRNYFNDSANDTYLVSKFNSSETQNKLLGQIAYHRAYMFGGNGLNSSYTTDNVGADKINDPSKYNRAYAYATITSTSNLNKYLGLDAMYEAVDDAFDYYYSYVQLAEDVDGDDVKTINGLISTLRANYDGFTSLNNNELEKLLNSITTTNQPTVLNQVSDIYEKLYTQYFKIVDSYADLTLGLQDFVVEYVFNNNLTFDKQTVAFNMILNSVSEWAEASKTENNAKVASYKVFTKNDKNEVVLSDNSLYIVYSVDVANVLSNYFSNIKFGESAVHFQTKISDSVVEAYSTLANKYNEALSGSKSIFKLNNAQKHKLFVVNTETNTETGVQVPVYNETQAEYDLTYFNRIRLVLNSFYKLSTQEVA